MVKFIRLKSLLCTFVAWHVVIYFMDLLRYFNKKSQYPCTQLQPSSNIAIIIDVHGKLARALSIGIDFHVMDNVLATAN